MDRSNTTAQLKKAASLCMRLPRACVCLLAIEIFLALFCLVYQSFFSIRLFYDFNTIILPIILIVVAVVGYAKWNRRPYERGILRASTACLAVALLLAGIRIYATHIEPYRLKLKRVTIQTDKVTRPFTILHISDIQVRNVGEYEKRAFAMMRELHPDLILFTGDLIQTPPKKGVEPQLTELGNLIRTLNPTCGVWGVRGDVDWRIKGLSESRFGGLHFLDEQNTTINTEAAIFRVLGLSVSQSRYPDGSRELIKSWCESTKSNEFNIVIGHAPDYVLSILDIPIDLCLAGHTHGGQIRIPLIGPIVTLSKVPRAWARGFREVGKTRLNVSAGIGSEHADGIPPIRFHCHPEMTLIELVPKNQPESARPTPNADFVNNATICRSQRCSDACPHASVLASPDEDIRRYNFSAKVYH